MLDTKCYSHKIEGNGIILSNDVVSLKKSI